MDHIQVHFKFILTYYILNARHTCDVKALLRGKDISQDTIVCS